MGKEGADWRAISVVKWKVWFVVTQGMREMVERITGFQVGSEGVYPSAEPRNQEEDRAQGQMGATLS